MSICTQEMILMNKHINNYNPKGFTKFLGVRMI